MTSDEKAEMLRQLRAARDGRFLENDAGRYVIEGEARPAPKVRKSLLYGRGWITWTFKPKGMVLTPEGEAALEALEASRGS